MRLVAFSLKKKKMNLLIKRIMCSVWSQGDVCLFGCWGKTYGIEALLEVVKEAELVDLNDVTQRSKRSAGIATR